MLILLKNAASCVCYLCLQLFIHADYHAIFLKILFNTYYVDYQLFSSNLVPLPDPVDFIRKTHNSFGLLINSLCPYIYGHQFVKAGLLLALAGAGTPQDDCHRRDTVHVLLVGDPGLGKTHLLQACKSVSPRGIFVSGQTTTVAGLTVSLTR